MDQPASTQCTTCYGAGETATDRGLEVCPDCFGDGKPLGRGTKLEWRLRQIERANVSARSEGTADVLWLIHELRRGREALLAILTRCQDAEEGDVFAAEIRFRAYEALGLYDAATDPSLKSVS